MCDERLINGGFFLWECTVEVEPGMVPARLGVRIARVGVFITRLHWFVARLALVTARVGRILARAGEEKDKVFCGGQKTTFVFGRKTKLFISCFKLYFNVR